MIEIAFRRTVSRVIASPTMEGWMQGEVDRDGKIKAPTAVGRMWLVGRMILTMRNVGALALSRQSLIRSTVQPPSLASEATATTRESFG